MRVNIDKAGRVLKNKLGLILRRGSDFILYAIRSKSRYRIHSQFVYEFIEYVFSKESLPSKAILIEEWRKQCKKNKQSIEMVDYGAGGNGSTRKVKISSLVKSSISKRKGAFLYRCALFCGAKEILELGTCLGISTAYLAMSGATVTSVEGCPTLCQISSAFLQNAGFNNVKLVNTRFPMIIEQFLDENKKFDLIFLDGDHKPYTLRYYIHSLCNLLNENGILIIDDIRYDRKTYRIWQECSHEAHPLLIVEFFNLGLIFNTQRFQKEFFALWSSRLI